MSEKKRGGHLRKLSVLTGMWDEGKVGRKGGCTRGGCSEEWRATYQHVNMERHGVLRGETEARKLDGHVLSRADPVKEERIYRKKHRLRGHKRNSGPRHAIRPKKIICGLEKLDNRVNQAGTMGIIGRNVPLQDLRMKQESSTSSSTHRPGWGGEWSGGGCPNPNGERKHVSTKVA